MTPNEFRRRAKDKSFIKGIHNYCDYWCDRCPLTHRCAISPATLGETRRPEEMTAEEAVAHVAQHLRDTLDMVKEMAAKHGIDVTRGPTTEELAEEEAREKRVRSHPLAKAAYKYSRKVQKWFEAREQVFREKAEQLESIARMGLETRNPAAEAQAISEAMDVILWYQYFIGVKLMRGLDDEDRAFEELHGFPKDSDGSAKISLIGMDRSIEAWAGLMSVMPAEEDSILDFLVGLRRLRQGAEKHFPDARAFVRPGFDELTNRS